MFIKGMKKNLKALEEQSNPILPQVAMKFWFYCHPENLDYIFETFLIKLDEQQ